MNELTLYVCPVHQDIVLYKESFESIDLLKSVQGYESVIPERPKFCDECKKSYYQWECKKIHETKRK